MKTVVSTFVAMFVVFFCIGFLRGILCLTDKNTLYLKALDHVRVGAYAPKIRKEPEIIPQIKTGLGLFNDNPPLLSASTPSGNEPPAPGPLEGPPKTDSTTNPIVLEYYCKQQVLYRWDIDSKTLYFPTTNSLGFLDQKDDTPFPITANESLAFLGGVSGAWNVKDVLTKAASEDELKWRQLAAGILGAVSGYFAGYNLATSRPPDCDTPKVLNQISQKSVWETSIERDELRILLARTSRQAERNEDPGLRRELDEARSREATSLSDRNLKLAGADFAWIWIDDGHALYRGELARKHASNSSKTDWFIISWAVVIGVVSILVYGTVSALHQRIIESNRHKGRLPRRTPSTKT